jgi:hypothetical protein
MKVRLFENSKLPVWLKVDGITIYPFIFINCSKQEAMDNRILNHECVHVLQVRKLGWFKFYGLYVAKYAKYWWKFRNQQQAYMAISFEMEAYAEQNVQPVLPELL